MFISVGGEVLSSEGTTQRDPLGMVMYTLAVIPLINKLQELHVSTSQVWFADDATAGSTCQRRLVAHSPSFGYYHKASKTFLIVKAEQSLTDEALKQKQSSISSPLLNNDCWNTHGSLPCLLMNRAPFCSNLRL